MTRRRKRHWLLAVTLIFSQMAVTACAGTAGETPDITWGAAQAQTSEAPLGSSASPAGTVGGYGSGEDGGSLPAASKAPADSPSGASSAANGQTGTLDLPTGEFVDDNGDVNLTVEPDGAGYHVEIGIFRLTKINDGVGWANGDKIAFTATDAGGAPISGEIVATAKGADVIFTNSTWTYIHNGDRFSYYSSGAGQADAAAAYGAYDAGDIAVINAMIDGNQLSAKKDAPDSWQFAVWDLAAGSKRRICELYLTGMNLTGRLDVSGLSHLNRLDCSNNQLQTLNVAGTALTYLDCSVNPLTSLDGLGGLRELDRLYCAASQLQHLDLTGLTALTDLGCHNSQLQDLDLSGLSSLVKLHCAGNQLKALDLSAQTALTVLDCSANPLTQLTGLSRLSVLEKLDCSNGRLQSLDVTGLAALTTLDCHKNQLTGLTGLSGLTRLQQLYCDSNQLNALDLSGPSALTELYCEKNQLAALDLTGLDALSVLECGENPLTSFKARGQELDISAGTGGMAVISYVVLDRNQAVLDTTPAPGFTFKSWKGLPPGSPNTPNTSITLSDSFYLTAAFDPL